MTLRPANPPPDYSANVRAEVARSGLHLQDVRRNHHVGLTPRQWALRMSGDTAWTAAELQAIADALGIDVARLYATPGGG